MKRLRRLRRQYIKLTVEERFRLYLAAHKRGDLEEIYALDESCPPEDAKDYLVRLIEVERVASVLAIQLLAFQVGISALSNGLRDVADPTDPAARPKEALERLLKWQRTLWRAFAHWCQQRGHDPPSTLRLALFGMDEREPAYALIHYVLRHFILDQLQNLERGAQEISELTPDPAAVEAAQELFEQF